MEIKNKVAISNIYIELTRACNLNCPHCLRGDADNNSFMSFDQIDRILDNFSICQHITMGGGEPCLAKNEMFYLMDSIEKRLKTEKIKTFVFNIGMVTNGTILDDEIVDRLNSFTEVLLYHIDKEKNDKNKPLKVINIAISNDQYHNNNPKEAMNWYKDRVNQNIRVSYNKLSNKGKYDIAECKRSKKNGIEGLKRYGIADLHRFSLVNNSLTKIVDNIEIPLLDGDCLTFTSKGTLICNGFYDFSEVDNPDFPNLMGNYMENEVNDLILKWNNKHPLDEKHTIVFERMMKNAMTESDRKRIMDKFINKENEVKKIKEENPDMNIFDIYDKVLHF